MKLYCCSGCAKVSVCLLLWGSVLLGDPLGSHCVAQGLSTSADASANAPYTVTGTVVNGLNGSAIPRALVRINGRAAMTDNLGHFSFPGFTGITGSVQVMRPGYAISLDDAGARPFQIVDLTGRLELKLYPNAVITGVVTGSDRIPVEHAQVTLTRENLEETGPRTIQAGSSQTDSHGEYRFNEPPGRYRISINYSQRASVDGSVMLPLDYPESGTLDTPPMFTVSSNEERRIDLHPRTAAAYPVRFRIEGEDVRYNPRVTVKSATGASFGVFARNTREEGVFELMLPSGTYQMRATTQNRDGRQEAEAHVTVAGHAVDGLLLHFGPVPAIPLELIVESTASTSNGSTSSPLPPRLNSLGLRLQSSSRSDQFGGDDVGISTASPDRSVLEVSPGVYRLRGQFLSQWYVRSATYGGVNLLTQPLTVVDGAGGAPLRIVVANDTGQLAGKVTGAPVRTTCYLYLLAHQPSLFPVVQAQTNLDGTYSRALPPGSYTAYAFPRRFPGDLHNPELSGRLSSGTEVTVPASGKISLDLAVQPAELSR